MQMIAWLFGEAWEHRRRRHRNVIIVLSAAAVLGVLIARLGEPPVQSPSRLITSVAQFEASSSVLAKTPVIAFSPDLQLGRHCAVLNSIACDSIVVFLQLKSPAESVAASVNGRKISLHPAVNLNPFGDQAAASFRAGTVFTGKFNPPASPRTFPHPPIQTSAGPRPTIASIRLIITSLDSGRVTTRLEVVAARGWARP